jgi:hypothetical protein
VNYPVYIYCDIFLVNMVEGSPKVRSTASLIDSARCVLMEPDPFEKQKLTDEIASLWREGTMQVGAAHASLPVVDQPARSGLVRVLEPSKMPKMGKGGSLSSRQVPLPSQCLDVHGVSGPDCSVPSVRFTELWMYLLALTGHMCR